MLSITLVAATLLVGEAIAAPCGTWNPPVSAAPKTGVESKAIAVSWTNAPPVGCTISSGDDWDGTNKLMLRRAAGSTAPSDPTSGTLVANMPPTATSRDDFVHRSDKTYAYALFACEDSSCNKDWSSHDWYVTYWNGSSWEDDALIEFQWDGSASGPSHDCIENPAAVVHAGGGSINEGMAFMLMDSDICPLLGTGLDDDMGTSCPTNCDDGAIVFSELSN